VFRRFSDMERLFVEMSTRMQAEVLPLLLDGEPRGDSSRGRARSSTGARSSTSASRATSARPISSARARRTCAGGTRARAAPARRAPPLAPELRRAPAALVDALELATSFEAWDRLRIEQRLGRERAHAAVERIVLDLIAELKA
jgi:hypothetical protein